MSEETGQVATTQVATITNDPMTTNLVKQGVTEAVIESLGRHLVLDKPITSKEEREEVRKAHRECRDIIGIIESVGKEERDEAVKYQRFVLAEVKSRVKRIDPVADKLKKRLSDYDNQEQLRFLESAKKLVAQIEERKNKLWEAGFQYHPIEKRFFYEEISFPDEGLSALGFNDAALDETCRQVVERIRTAKEVEAAEHEQAEAEREAKEAADKELQEKLARLAEFERKEKEQSSSDARERMLVEAKAGGERQELLDVEEAARRRADSKKLRRYLVTVGEFSPPPDMESKDGKELQERLNKGLSFMDTLIARFIEYTPGTDATD